MRKSFLRTAAAALVLAGVLAADPASAYYTESRADHNGSEMIIINNDGAITIEYARPKRSIRRHGVRPGTVLFTGTIRGQTVEGEARVFRDGCAPAEYWVSGRWRGGTGRIVLRGEAPVRERGGCDVIDHTSDSSNARLVFNITRAGDPDHNDDGAGDDHVDDGDRCGWFVVLTCNRSRSAANRSLDDLGGPGTGGQAGIRVVHTNDYPNFRNGWYCVVDGPYRSRGVAQSIAWKEAVPSAYVKRGC